MAFLRPWLRIYDDWDAKRNGTRDGCAGIPHLLQEDPPEYLWELKQVADSHNRELQRRWQRVDGRLHDAYCRHEAACKAANIELGRAKSLHEEAEERYERETGQKPTWESKGAAWYKPLMIFLFIIEFPVNALVFDIFEQSLPLTLLMALLPSAALVFGSHFLGWLLREGPLQSVSKALSTLALLSVPVGLFVAFGYWRENYLQDLNKESGTFMSIDPIAIFWAFLLMNLIVYVIGTVASIAAHEPLTVAAGRLQRARNAVRFSQNRLARAKARRIAAVKQADAVARRTKDCAQRLWAVYKKHNLLHRDIQQEAQQAGRTDLYIPASFNNPPSIDVPKPIADGAGDPDKNLDWTCPDYVSDAEEAQAASDEGLMPTGGTGA